MKSLQGTSCRQAGHIQCANQRSGRPRHKGPSSTAATWSVGRAVSAPVTGNPVSAPAASPATKSTDTVTVHFRQEGTSTQAKPGEDLLEVASRCSADIPTGCLHGSCGVCEVELHKFGPDGREAGSPVVMRACVAKVPRGWGRVEVGMLSADSVWGQDGWDT